MTECRIAKNRYGSYCVPAASMHRPAARAILNGEVWEPETINLITSSVGVGDVVHAGAYFGDALPAISLALAPGAKLWAFEPNPENFAAAARTCAINNLGNVVLRRLGLGAGNSAAKMRVRKRGESLGGGSRVARRTLRSIFRPPPATDMLDVRLGSIDELVPSERHVSVIHLDIEEFEDLALDGAIKTIERCAPLLVLESIPRRWIARLAAIGYGLVASLEGNVAFAARLTPQAAAPEDGCHSPAPARP